MQIIEDKALIVNTRNPDRITNTIKKSANLGDLGDGVFGVLVHWSLKAAQTLRTLRIKNVPSPIVRDYGWPGRYKPFVHQRTTAEFFTLHKKSFCFSETGTGKTASAIWAADYLMEQGLIRKVLVIGPLSILHSAWLNELFKLVPHRSAAIAHGVPEKRKLVISGGYEFVIINYDGVDIVRDDIKADGKFDLIIVDECNAVKTTTTRRWKIINSLIRPDSWVWLMTGTPAAQSPVDAYGLAKMVAPEKTPTYFGTYRDKVMYKQGMFKWVPRPNADVTVHNLLQPAIRFTKEECLDLPDMMYQDREVELTVQQLKYYRMLKEEMAMAVAGQDVSAVNAAVMMGKLLQISCISVDTDVLSSRGWIPISTVRPTDLLWDGVEWVAHQGVIYKGYTQTINCGGVFMTPDHNVLSAQGWITAQEMLDGEPGSKFTWEIVRIPDRGATSGDNTGPRNTVCPMVMPMCVPYTSRKTDVYDIVNCGPRNRFVVRGVAGTPHIVHNCGAVYSDDKNVVEFDATNRLRVLEEIINEASHKVLVFAQYTHNIDRIKEYLTKKGHTAEIIDGRVTMNKRTDIIQRFQNKSNPRILVIQPQAAGHGITLTAANMVVWFSPTLSLESYIQANARVNRPGQVNKMTVVHLQGSPVEKKIYRSLQDKQDLHIRVVDLYKEELNDLGSE